MRHGAGFWAWKAYYSDIQLPRGSAEGTIVEGHFDGHDHGCVAGHCLKPVHEVMRAQRTTQILWV